MSPALTTPWYVRSALKGSWRYAALALAGAALFAGCGGGERQDEDEPEGDFEVEVSRAAFPEKQRLAQSSDLVITVRNAGNRTIPNIAVTVEGFNFRKEDPTLSDAERPQFVINGLPREIGGFPEAKEATPLGCETAYVDTWACGRLQAGAEKTFRWSVTAVKAGNYRIRYSVAAGLDGKAKAVGAAAGGAPRGTFTGTVSDEAPEVRVADDGKTVVEGTR
jgi:hypothetical protein